MAGVTEPALQTWSDGAHLHLMEAIWRWCRVPREEFAMSTLRNSKLFATLGSMVDLFGSAAASAAAVEAGRAPKARDLRTLGIEPAAFRRIGKL